jgi:hypothetical protein
MLVATYALMTVSVKQNEQRRRVHCIRRYLSGLASHRERIDPFFLISQLEKLALLAESCQGHKFINRLIPAIREVTTEAGELLSRLETLNSSGRALLRVVRESLGRVHADGMGHMARLCSTMEVLPLAQRVVPTEAWFAIGASFLEDDALRNERPGLRPGRR